MRKLSTVLVAVLLATVSGCSPERVASGSAVMALAPNPAVLERYRSELLREQRELRQTVVRSREMPELPWVTDSMRSEHTRILSRMERRLTAVDRTLRALAAGSDSLPAWLFGSDRLTMIDSTEIPLLTPKILRDPQWTNTEVDLTRGLVNTFATTLSLSLPIQVTQNVLEAYGSNSNPNVAPWSAFGQNEGTFAVGGPTLWAPPRVFDCNLGNMNIGGRAFHFAFVDVEVFKVGVKRLSDQHRTAASTACMHTPLMGYMEVSPAVIEVGEHAQASVQWEGAEQTVVDCPLNFSASSSAISVTANGDITGVSPTSSATVFAECRGMRAGGGLIVKAASTSSPPSGPGSQMGVYTDSPPPSTPTSNTGGGTYYCAGGFNWYISFDGGRTWEWTSFQCTNWVQLSMNSIPVDRQYASIDGAWRVAVSRSSAASTSGQ